LNNAIVERTAIGSGVGKKEGEERESHCFGEGEVIVGGSEFSGGQIESDKGSGILRTAGKKKGLLENVLEICGMRSKKKRGFRKRFMDLDLDRWSVAI
jgi:hypothetical protein